MLRFKAPPPGFTTRFAPAPTGLLHLGHVASAMLVFGAARAFGGRALLRIEDHDRSRARPEFEAAIYEDLRWLGFDNWTVTPRQSDRDDRYLAALGRLESRGLTYACACSRKSIESAAGADVREPRYQGACRSAGVDGDAHRARRVRLAETPIVFEDFRLGRIEQTPAAQCGDVLARDRTGQWTYQFAVVVDDLEQGVDLVIRGEDLLDSTGRQIQIARLLGRDAPPSFLHHSLITHEDGRKLSKSRGDTGVSEMRTTGRSPADILGAAGAVLGLSRGEPLQVAEVVERVLAAANG